MLTVYETSGKQNDLLRMTGEKEKKWQRNGEDMTLCLGPLKV